MLPRARRALVGLVRDGPSAPPARRRLDGLGADLARALERDELALSYQPIVVVSAARCDRVEALLRWTHPVHGPVDPRDVVEAARETDLLLRLAVWVLRAAARQRAVWERASDAVNRILKTRWAEGLA